MSSMEPMPPEKHDQTKEVIMPGQEHQHSAPHSAPPPEEKPEKQEKHNKHEKEEHASHASHENHKKHKK